MEPTRQELRAWLRQALEKTGETPTGLARRAGLAQTTVTRFLNGDDAPMLGLRSIAKIAHVAGLQPIGFAQPTGARMRGFSEPEALPLADTRDERLQARLAALIQGEKATDPWELRTRALEEAGYLPGDILIVDLNATAKAGDVVCAQSYRWSERSADTVFRLYEPSYLVAASRDPDLRRPLLVDNDNVIIKGVVVAMLRERR